MRERLDERDRALLRDRDLFNTYGFNGYERNCLFVNARGRRFIEAGYPLGVDIDLEGRGVAVADLDQDGGLDLVVRSVARKKLTYLHNEIGAESHFLRFDLIGTRSNRDAIGTVIRLVTSTDRQMRVKMAGNGFQGQSEATLHFGLGSAKRAEEVVVLWASGLEERFFDLPADHLIRIVEGEGKVSLSRLPGWRPTAEPSHPKEQPSWQAWTLDGKPWRPSAPGRPTLVSLWASWCIPCRAEVPSFNSLHERLGDRVNLVGISFEPDAVAAREFVSQTKPRYPVALSHVDALAPLLSVAFSDGVVALPAAVLIDGEGAVYRVLNGTSVEAIEREILRLRGVGS